MMNGKFIRIRRKPFLLLSLIIVAMSFPGPGCGPSAEEIRAREQARLALEARARAEAEASRQAEAERLSRISALEAAGDAAVRQGQFEQALEHYRAVLGSIVRYGEQDLRVRRAVIATVRSMPSPPQQPEGQGGRW